MKTDDKTMYITHHLYYFLGAGIVFAFFCLRPVWLSIFSNVEASPFSSYYVLYKLPDKRLRAEKIRIITSTNKKNRPIILLHQPPFRLLAHGRWFSPGTPASSTTKTGGHDIAEILLKVALNTIKWIKSTNLHSVCL
jgi:hypothetical protein